MNRIDTLCDIVLRYILDDELTLSVSIWSILPVTATSLVVAVVRRKIIKIGFSVFERRENFDTEWYFILCF